MVHFVALMQMQNISLRSSGMHRKQNFVILGFKSDAAVLTFTFLFLSSPLFSLFVAFFFLILLVLRGFILVGKTFRTLGLNERMWVVEQDFYGKFQVKVT